MVCAVILHLTLCRKHVLKMSFPREMFLEKTNHQKRPNPKKSNLTPKSKVVSYLNIILSQSRHFDKSFLHESTQRKDISGFPFQGGRGSRTVVRNLTEIWTKTTSNRPWPHTTKTMQAMISGRKRGALQSLHASSSSTCAR